MSSPGGSEPKASRNVSDGTSKDSSLYGVIALLAAIIFGVLIFYYFIRKQSHKLQFVLIVGRNDSGKTSLFAKLTQDRNVLTVSSLVKNIAWTKNLIPNEPGKEVQLIDVPGFERIRWDVFESSRSLCKGVIYLVDSVTISRDSQECADILYRILIDPEIQRRKVPILLACNKQDEVAAKDIEVIQEILEREMNSIRVTKFNPATQKGNRGEFLGNFEKDFSFSQLRNSLHLTRCTVKGTETESDVAGVVDFLRTLA